MHEIVLESALKKRTTGRFGVTFYHERYFVIYRNNRTYQLRWFHKSNEGKPIGIVLGEWIVDIIEDNHEKKNEFIVKLEYAEERTSEFVFIASNDHIKKQWCDILKHIIDNNRLKGSEHTNLKYYPNGDKYWKDKQWLQQFATHNNKLSMSQSTPIILQEEKHKKTSRRALKRQHHTSMPELQQQQQRQQRDISDEIEDTNINIKSILEQSSPFQGSFTEKFPMTEYVQSTLHEFFQEHWSEWSHIIQQEQLLLLCGFESLLLYISMNNINNNDNDDYKFASTVLRVRCGLTKKAFDYIEHGLHISDREEDDNTGWLREKSFASYRLLLINDAIKLLSSSTQWTPDLKWFERQMSMVLSSLLGFLLHHENMEHFQQELIHISNEFRQIIHDYMNNNNASTLHKVETTFEKWLKCIREAENAAPLAKSCHETQAPLIPYPIELRSLLYMMLVYTCYEEVDVDSDDDSDDDCDDEVVRVHHHYERILSMLQYYCGSNSCYRLPAMYHRLCFLRVLIDCVMEQVLLPSVTPIDVLANDMKLMKLFQLVVIMDTDDENNTIVNDSRFALITTRLKEWCLGSVWTWISNTDFASPANTLIVRLMHIFTRMVHWLQPSLHAATELARCRYYGAVNQLEHWKLTYKNDWNQIKSKILQLVQHEFKTNDENAFKRVLGVSCASFFIAGFTLTLCNQATKLTKRELTKESSNYVMNVVSIIKSLQFIVVDHANDINDTILQYILEKSAIQVENCCSCVLKRTLSMKSKRLEDLRIRCVHLDEWTPINNITTHSSSVLDLFRILNSIQDHVFDLMDDMAPYGVYQLHYFLAVIESAVMKYSSMVCGTIGSIECISAYKDVKIEDLQILPNFTSQGIMEFLFLSLKKKPSSPSHLDRMKSESSMLKSQSLTSLCVRLSCLTFAQKELRNSCAILVQKWKHFETLLDRSRQTHEILHDYLPPPPQLPTATQLFSRVFKRLDIHVRNISVLISVHIVHRGLYKNLHESLYQSNTSNANTLIETLDDTMATLYQYVSHENAATIAYYVFEELTSAWKWIILNDNSRVLSIDTLRHDLLEICELFYAELGARKIVEIWKPLYSLLYGFERSSDELMALVDTMTTTSNMMITKNDLLLTLRHRGKSFEKFVKKRI